MATREKKLIAIVMYPGMTALDVVGAMETLIILNVNSPYRLISVGERPEPVQTDTPLKLVPNRTFAQSPAPFRLVVPGGGAAALAAVRDETLLRYVRSAGERAGLVASIGTGSLILAAAGLLEGRQATTHWAYAHELERLGVRYTRRRWVEDGRFITAAGVTAGIDMSLHLLARLTSKRRARAAQLMIEYDPQPPFGGIDWDRLEREQAAPGPVAGPANEERGGRDDPATAVPVKEHVQ
jgi:transcriptional regulator GlxA family with amidase domain